MSREQPSSGRDLRALAEDLRRSLDAIGAGDYVNGVEGLRGLYDGHAEDDLRSALSVARSTLVDGANPERWIQVAGAPLLADSLYNLGTILWESDSMRGSAHGVFELADTHGSKDAGTALGVVLVAEGRPDDATPYLTRSVERRDMPWRQSAGLLGEIYLDRGASDSVVEELLTSAVSEYPEFRVPLARLYPQKGDIDLATDIVRGAAKSSEYGAAIILGNILASQGDVPGAIRAYQQGIAEGDGHSAYNLYLLLLENDDLRGAKEALSRARSMGDLTNPAAESELAHLPGARPKGPA